MVQVPQLPVEFGELIAVGLRGLRLEDPLPRKRFVHRRAVDRVGHGRPIRAVGRNFETVFANEDVLTVIARQPLAPVGGEGYPVDLFRDWEGHGQGGPGRGDPFRAEQAVVDQIRPVGSGKILGHASRSAFGPTSGAGQGHIARRGLCRPNFELIQPHAPTPRIPVIGQND